MIFSLKTSLFFALYIKKIPHISAIAIAIPHKNRSEGSQIGTFAMLLSSG